MKGDRQPIKTVTVVVGDDGRIGILAQHRSGRQLAYGEILQILNVAQQGPIYELSKLEQETPVDRARKHIVAPPKGLRIRKEGER
jgi:hypothetical protein